MIWNKLKGLIDFKQTADVASAADLPKQVASPVADQPAPNSTPPQILWIPADKNPWGVPLLDVRPFTLSMMSTSSDPQCATNAVSFGREDGLTFKNQRPASNRVTASTLTFQMDRVLADGVLFVPRQMEHKWAIFHHDGKLIFVRSWTRKVQAVASVERRDGLLTVTEIEGIFTSSDESPEFTERCLDFLIRTHVLGLSYPAALPPDAGQDTTKCAMWCFSVFGNMVHVATFSQIDRTVPERVLRTHSLLHIAVARAETDKIASCLSAGVPVELLAGDGLAPLHWAGANFRPVVAELLLAAGSDVDVRSDQGATPLMNAVQGNNLDFVNFLIGKGADVNALDLNGFSALHRAAEMGHFEIARILLEHNASPLVVARDHTPLSLAEKAGEPQMIGLLKNYISSLEVPRADSHEGPD